MFSSASLRGRPAKSGDICDSATLNIGSIGIISNRMPRVRAKASASFQLPSLEKREGMATPITFSAPKASTAKNAESKSVTVQLNMQKDVFLNGEKTTWENLKAGITAKLVGTKDRAVVINIDRGVEYGSAVKLMDIVNQCDAAIVLATEVDK